MSRGRILAFVAVIALIVGGIRGGPYLWTLIQYYCHAEVAASRAEGAEADWRAAFGDPNTLLASFARDDDNASAKRLESLVKPLGIELGEPTAQVATDARPFSIYVSAESATRAGPPPHAPSPGDVRAFLETHRPELHAIVDELATNDPPAWKCDMSSIVPQLRGNLMGLRTLDLVLAADAIDQASSGHATEADRTMRAAWQLVRSGHDQPLLVNQLIAMALATIDTAVVRRLDVDAAAWRPRLADYDYAAGLVRAIESEAAVRVRANHASSMTARAFRADYLDGMRADIAHMRTISLTDPLEPTPDLDHLPVAAPGTIIAEIATAGFDRAWLAAHGVMLDLELTDRVLELRQLKAKTGRWPASMPDVASPQAPGAEWVYAVGPDGGISISLNRSVPSIARAPKFEAQR
jgi:hypothetical protein